MVYHQGNDEKPLQNQLFTHIAGSYRNYTDHELVSLVQKQMNRETAMKWPEMQRLYDAGQQRVPPNCVSGACYGHCLPHRRGPRAWRAPLGPLAHRVPACNCLAGTPILG